MISHKAKENVLPYIRAQHTMYFDPMAPYEPYKVSDVYVYPLFDEVFLPYTEATITPVSDYQKEVLQAAIRFDTPIVLVPEKEYASIMPDQIMASKFKGCFGVFAWPVISNGNEENFEVVAQMGFQCEITSSRWKGSLASATVVEKTPMLIRRDDREEEIENLLEDRFAQILQFLSPDSRKMVSQRLERNAHGSQNRFNFMILNSPLEFEDQLELLYTFNLSEQRLKFMKMLSKSQSKLMIREELNRQTLEGISQRQKEEFLRAQIKTLEGELSMDSNETEESELRKRADAKEWSEETKQDFDKELRKLLRYAPNSPEYAMQYSYLDTFLNLPWQHYDNSRFELEDVERVLNRDHFALDKVKERIIEQMAVLKLRNDLKAPILCLVGPPGVGKTSLGKSVAEALGRKYVRVALGGVHDEAEIRGHRKTYLGSMPGRIISALEKCGTSDPVMVLDEIDKLGADYKGDPSTALLEVLDPEQNNRFHDNYIDHDYDLSKVLFIATANSLDPISGPLLDRMEIINIDGYVEQEKLQIAIRHLVPRNLERHGFAKDEIRFEEDAIREIINLYTRESGVRQLEKRIAQVLRKQARLKAGGKPVNTVITAADMREMLGPQAVFPDLYESNDIPGVVTGLAWTQAGGEILFIESSVAEAKESKLVLTGNLGNVMKESAAIALQYARAHADKYGLTHDDFDNKLLHIHVPEGAIPKDGPSAGITMLTSIMSAFTERKVRLKTAMTGELTLRGKVLPVGGIKEKILAAKRAGITDIALSEQNRKDVEDIPSGYLEGLSFHYFSTAAEVLDFALLP